MKVKVNGSWVDVPAFKVVEQVKDFEVLEGDITLTSALNILTIEHNKGLAPFCVHLELTTPIEVSASVLFSWYESVLTPQANYYETMATTTTLVQRAIVKVDTITAVGQFTIDANNVVIRNRNNSFPFKAGTYHYKIYYAI